MKRCPRCERTFPDTEKFCGDDGTALVPATGARTTAVDAPPIPSADVPPDPDARIECPVCGGKAEPGEVICNFCGARLDQTAAPHPPQQSGMFRAGTMQAPPPPPRSTGETIRVNDQDHSFDDESPLDGGAPPSRGIVGIIGYIVAALVALGGGIWLALHLSSSSGTAPVATASPSAVASPVVATGPIVSLASNLLVQVSGSAATAPERNVDAVTKAFNDNRAGLSDVYKAALMGNSSLNDGMVVHLSIDAAGKVESSSVKVSTAPNPSLDAEVLNLIVTWKFAPSSAGESGADYPIIFATDPSQVSGLETALSNRIAGINPGEPPEYAFAPGATPTPEPMAAPLPPPPAVVMPPPVPAPPPAPRRRIRATPVPLSLLRRVQYRLASDPKLRRVQAYTSGGMVTLYGTVFDDKAKRYAEQVVGAIPGVTSVIDNMTTDTAKWAAEQNRITAQLQGSGLTGVTVTVIGPNAYLAGTVKSDVDKQRAVTITESAAPVKVRGNIIMVQPGSIF
jgi:TonB family protein